MKPYHQSGNAGIAKRQGKISRRAHRAHSMGTRWPDANSKKIKHTNSHVYYASQHCYYLPMGHFAAPMTKRRVINRNIDVPTHNCDDIMNIQPCMFLYAHVIAKLCSSYAAYPQRMSVCLPPLPGLSDFKPF
ncbi:hypothetical protein HALA3H3_690002 [Halomonas sp. A3H3]|nr:hypothetical protein HALA3H3_690002 [Halomonas sp. A3H3]